MRCRRSATGWQSAARARVIGAVTVGDGAGIGAMTLVICGLPDATAVGIPARLLPVRPDGIP